MYWCFVLKTKTYATGKSLDVREGQQPSFLWEGGRKTSDLSQDMSFVSRSYWKTHSVFANHYLPQHEPSVPVRMASITASSDRSRVQILVYEPANLTDAVRASPSKCWDISHNAKTVSFHIRFHSQSILPFGAIECYWCYTVLLALWSVTGTTKC